MAADVLVLDPAGPGAVAPRRPRDRFHRGALRWVILALAVLVALAMMVPFVIMVLNAFKSPGE